MSFLKRLMARFGFHFLDLIWQPWEEAKNKEMNLLARSCMRGCLGMRKAVRVASSSYFSTQQLTEGIRGRLLFIASTTTTTRIQILGFSLFLPKIMRHPRAFISKTLQFRAVVLNRCAVVLNRGVLI